jgi:hypothetical protein
MGGYGGGRRRSKVKRKTSDYLLLDLPSINPLWTGQSFQWTWSRNVKWSDRSPCPVSAIQINPNGEELGAEDAHRYTPRDGCV